MLVFGLDCSDILKSLESWALSSTIFGQGPVIRFGIKESVESSLVESLDVFESRKILVSSKERFLTVKSFAHCQFTDILFIFGFFQARCTMSKKNVK